MISLLSSFSSLSIKDIKLVKIISPSLLDSISLPFSWCREGGKSLVTWPYKDPSMFGLWPG